MSNSTYILDTGLTEKAVAAHKEYFSLCKKFLEREDVILEPEKHHIKPKAFTHSFERRLGKNNALVRVTKEEHCHLHKLLCEIYPYDSGMANAYRLCALKVQGDELVKSLEHSNFCKGFAQPMHRVWFDEDEDPHVFIPKDKVTFNKEKAKIKREHEAKVKANQKKMEAEKAEKDLMHWINYRQFCEVGRKLGTNNLNMVEVENVIISAMRDKRCSIKTSVLCLALNIGEKRAQEIVCRCSRKIPDDEWVGLCSSQKNNAWMKRY